MFIKQTYTDRLVLLRRINSREYLLKIPMHNETITFAWGYK